MSNQSGWNDDVFNAPLDTLRLTRGQWHECIQEIKKHETARGAPASDSRSHERRSSYNAVHMLANMIRADGHRQLFNIRTFDISESGVGFLHGAYVHVGTEMEMYLKHRLDGWVKIHATVKRCNHFKKRIHQIGVMFAEPIEVDDYFFKDAQLGPDELDAA